ncbi:MAG: peptidoglycan bridge formation glycyltransferase FemA/FemB family protein [Clostridia bacterium]
MEILSKDKYNEYEAFASSFCNTNFTQSIKWISVKTDWKNEVIVSRDEKGKIVGGMLLLIRKKPNFLYAPRGPLFDYQNKAVFLDLLNGVKEIAKREHSYLFKIDPYILEDNKEFDALCRSNGFKLNEKSLLPYQALQPRVNYIINIKDKTIDTVFENFHKKWRYNVRVAQKHNVTCKEVGTSGLEDFYRLFSVTAKRDGFICRPKEYFKKILESFNGDVKLYLCYYENVAISGAITSYFGNRCVYIYGASDNNHRNVMPNYLMQYTMIKDAISCGCTVYDFMGISGYQDENDKSYGVYKFKSGFGGEIAPYIGEYDYIFSPVKKAINDTLLSLRTFLLSKLRKK